MLQTICCSFNADSYGAGPDNNSIRDEKVSAKSLSGMTMKKYVSMW